MLNKSFREGLVICYYGNGKGKTTAALGLALRASGYGGKVKIIQFIKGPWKSSEEQAIKNIKDITVEKYGAGFVKIQNDRKSLGEHRLAAQKGFKAAKDSLKQKDLFLLVLDEILGAVKGELLKSKDVIELIKQKPPKLNLVLTGRPKINEIIAFCDLVSQMKEVKHPFSKGRLAKKGIDY